MSCLCDNVRKSQPIATPSIRMLFSAPTALFCDLSYIDPLLTPHIISFFGTYGAARWIRLEFTPQTSPILSTFGVRKLTFHVVVVDIFIFSHSSQHPASLERKLVLVGIRRETRPGYRGKRILRLPRIGRPTARTPHRESLIGLPHSHLPH